MHERSELLSREEVLRIAVKCGLVSTPNLADQLPNHYVTQIERFAAAIYEAGAQSERAVSDRLQFDLLAASNYIEALGGVSKSYRSAIAEVTAMRQERKEKPCNT